MSAMSDAVKNGPRATSAKAAHIEAQIKLAEAKGKKASDRASALRKRAKGDGPLAKSRRVRADAQATVADRHRAKANELRTDLAKAKADETARNVKHVKRTVASTAAEGLVPKQQARPARPGRAKTGGGGQVAKPRRTSPRQEAIKDFNQASNGRDLSHIAPGGILRPTKGTPAMTVSGEAVNVEQTRAMLAQIKTQVGELRGSMEGASGSLASGGLNRLAGSFASADDPLASVLTELETADKHLADQEAIAEAAQAAGEMHGDKSFYGA